ncbi:hypothetical protein AAG570_009638 [Ranatra chinensis]|uniref:Uncharacterized protein n=1 Tax=Ranatra chinensis TaxID=642074 RepID=A0ABD0YPN5_9HEMI
MLRHGVHHSGRAVRQLARHRQRHAASQAPRHHQLLRRLSRPGRHAGGHLGDVLQRQRRDNGRPLAVRVFHVRRVELTGRLLLDRLHTPPVLHQCGPLLRNSPTARLPPDHDPEEVGHHADRGLVLARPRFLPADIHGLVHHRTTLALQAPQPGRLHFRGEQTLRGCLVQRFLLGARGHHDLHVLQDLHRGRPPGENALQVRPFA